VRQLIATALPGHRGPTPTGVQSGWVPADSCRLPTADQPLRVAQFDDLFATAVRSAPRVEPTRLLLELVPEPAVAARAAELAAWEADCCGLFTFTLTAADQRLQLEVPPSHGTANAGSSTARPGSACGTGLLSNEGERPPRDPLRVRLAFWSSRSRIAWGILRRRNARRLAGPPPRRPATAPVRGCRRPGPV
jgi:hypothetical protein